MKHQYVVNPDTQLACQKLYLQTYKQVAADYQHPLYDALRIGDHFHRIGMYLQLLEREYSERLRGPQVAQFVQCIQKARANRPSTDKEKASELAAETYLKDCKQWLDRKPCGTDFTLTGLALFLQTARTGRRNFQAAGYDPERFVSWTRVQQATICKLALSDFRISFNNPS